MKFKKHIFDFFREFRERPPVLFPYLVAVLYSVNQLFFLFHEYRPSISVIVLNLILLATLVFLVHFFWRIMIHQRFLAGMIAGYTMFIFLYYFDVYILIYDNLPWITHKIHFGYNVLLMGIYILVGVLVYFIFRKLKNKLHHINNYLTIIFVIFIGIEAGKAVLSKTFTPFFTTLPKEKELTFSGDSLPLPDVYYIIFDSYTSSSSLKTFWGFDNSDIENYLEQKGFFIARKSKSNYDGTQYSISSTLNMSYLNVRNVQDDKNTPQIKGELLTSYSNVADYLKNHGYIIKAFTLFNFMDIQNFYGRDYSCPDFYDRTLLKLLKVKTSLATSAQYYADKHKDLQVIDSLIATARVKRNKPVFVYAHIYLPHSPFFYDKDGNEMPDEYAFGDMSPAKYLEQVKFVNKLIKKMLDEMMPYCSDNAVIIIQGDHGFRFMGEEEKWDVPSEGSTIMNAYYFPKREYELLYDSISPVNSFRVILNKYCKTQLPLLKDTSYYLQEEEGLRN
jgi:hypothetical protein